MQKSESLPRNNSPRLTQQNLRRLSLCSPKASGPLSSPIVFPEKRGKSKASKRAEITSISDDAKKEKNDDHRIDIHDEQSDLLGYEVFSGKIVFDKRKVTSSHKSQHSTEVVNQDAVDAKLTSKALLWGSHMLLLEDVISVSYSTGLRLFTVHAYPIKKSSYGLSCFTKKKRSQKDFRFFASSSEEAHQWVSGFADQQCLLNCLPHPLLSSKNQASDTVSFDFSLMPYIRSKSPPKVLVILNPRSGRGRSTKVFHGTVEPIFKLAGFEMEVVKTKSAGHAKTLASTVDLSTCPDGIICVGGDGIVNEVLNGLLIRENQREAISIPLGIIPAGSDNSLVWTVLGVSDPVSAAIAIVKGGLVATDVLAVEWIQTGLIHFGMTVSYFGFVSDVLELSEKYQKGFGPLRYLVAGVLKFLCLPTYNFEVEYLPVIKEATDQDGKASAERQVVDLSDLYTDIMRRSIKEGIPRSPSLSSIDSIMTPSRDFGGDHDTSTRSTRASSEPSDYVRGLDPKSKRLSSGRSSVLEEPEIVHSQVPHLSIPNWPRTRSKSKTDKGWSGLTITTHDSTRCSWGNTGTNDKEDISSTVSDPGPIWESEPKWDSEPNWGVENPIELPGPAEVLESESRKDVPRLEEKWVKTKGQFLAVLVCNHSCKTVQNFSQVVAPQADHDDNCLDLLLVRGSGRLRLLRFFILLQFGKHLSLPYVDYVKVKSVRLKQGNNTKTGCGIDGELLPVNGQVVSSILPEQCRLIGRSPNSKI